jgi:hypothetical protein
MAIPEMTPTTNQTTINSLLLMLQDCHHHQRDERRKMATPGSRRPHLSSFMPRITYLDFLDTANANQSNLLARRRLPWLSLLPTMPTLSTFVLHSPLVLKGKKSVRSSAKALRNDGRSHPSPLRLPFPSRMAFEPSFAYCAPLGSRACVIHTSWFLGFPCVLHASWLLARVMHAS